MPDLKMDSQKRWVLGQHVHVTVVTDAYSVIDITLPADVPGPPPHIHHDASELFYLLEGELEILCGHDLIQLTKGQSIVVPPGTLHTFTNRTSNPVRMLTVFNPAGFEKFFLAIGIPDQSPDARQASVQPAIINQVISEAASYHMEIPMGRPAAAEGA